MSFLFLDLLLLIFLFFCYRLPHPQECQLYYVNRDALFSYHKESEMFLQVYIIPFNLNSTSAMEVSFDLLHGL